MEEEFSFEEIEKMSPVILGVLNDKSFSLGIDLIIAGMLDLNEREYLSIEYEKNDISKYNYIIKQNLEKDVQKLKTYEISILNFIFNDSVEISRYKLEEKLKTSFELYSINYNQILKEVENELITNDYMRIIDNQKGKMEYTKKGNSLKETLIRYKKELLQKENIFENMQIENMIKNRTFINSVALHINTNSKETIISDNITNNAKKQIKKILIYIAIVALVLILICFIAGKITQKMSLTSLFWIIIIITMILAIIGDVAHEFATIKTKNINK